MNKCARVTSNINGECEQCGRPARHPRTGNAGRQGCQTCRAGLLRRSVEAVLGRVPDGLQSSVGALAGRRHPAVGVQPLHEVYG